MEVAVIVVLPALRAVTVPLLTVATVGSVLSHTKLLSVAVVGSTVAVRVELPPVSIDKVAGDSATDSTGTTGSVTFTTQASLTAPDFTIIIHLPLPTATTLPRASTFAICSLVEDQTKSTVVASAGEKVTFSTSDEPIVKSNSCLLRDIDLSGILTSDTVTVHFAFLPL